ncbi:Na+/H+ antiporter subunit C [Acuticoccus kandeliae]|uniref:Na+/H+ antiporter subunit C n=1 Tax=Acuticoccus kandeliae TaxID=2073160 RepID=UPI000D3EA31E|nr:Na+/H+ antiporter subunit C [Acuticoccus kandeliae]
METILCIVVGLFFAASIYLMLSPHMVRILLGVSIFGNAVNLLIFTSGRLTAAVPPVLSEHGPPTALTAEGAEVPGVSEAASAAIIEGSEAAHGAADAAGAAVQGAADATADAAHAVMEAALSATANPLPQALILTAIVISFSIFAFLLVLTFRAYQSLETDNVDDMRLAEPTPTVPPLGY